ncbi:HAD family hydrolase [Pajaroellobacter abortibovis]|uniref:Haloacid dehalogenase-like hydrolase n=1 Tax=Pajaroellobacter abortibovis TaxID=1882918 RepID=A0A1L6MYS6_9BACT|nr:HAD family hydrolase [Pajaroellobacter abortibovis]APS00683.1 hypothetical protein BCY86_08340 [Pajaroellobacter abortibovis]
MICNVPYTRLAFKEQVTLLNRVLARCTSKPDAPPPVVIFDIDGTLVDNRPRTCAILKEFAVHMERRGLPMADRLASVSPEQLVYLLTESLELLGIFQTDMVAEIEAFWRVRFFSESYLCHDIPLLGAVSFVRACYEAGATCLYLTARDFPLMGRGSFQSLRDLGFPIGIPGTQLVLKPDAGMPDEAFKRLEASKVARVGEVIAAFDNEPSNCNIFHSIYPHSDTVLLDTQHLPGAPPLTEGIAAIENFYRKINS